VTREALVPASEGEEGEGVLVCVKLLCNDQEVGVSLSGVCVRVCVCVCVCACACVHENSRYGTRFLKSPGILEFVDVCMYHLCVAHTRV
jgi:hypothetical protein